jgi:hypothetical protein
MHVQANPQTVGDYVTAIQANGIRINRDYQRGGGIWPSFAKSTLIETIILGYPMPALYLHQRFDKETRKAYREVVDGQQRTDAIKAFVEGDLRLSSVLSTERLRGKRFRNLDEDDFQAFMTYALPIFLFTDATEGDVRESFRRINSHTSTLNAMEKRHSTFQGPMKWFVVQLSKEVHSSLDSWGVINKRGLTRMEDAQLISEIVYAYLYGIRTTKAEQLDQMFLDHDGEDAFPMGDDIRGQFRGAFRELAHWDWLPSTRFVKPYHFMMVVLAVAHAMKPIATLEPLTSGGLGVQPMAVIGARMSELEAALDEADVLADSANVNEDDEAAADAGQVTANVGTALSATHQEFVAASRERTNTAETRTTRFLTFYKAITDAP